MGNINITSLPVAIGLDGTELVWIVQGATTDKRTTTLAIAGLVTAAFPPTIRTQRSIVSAGQATITTFDQTLNVNVAAPLTITVPAYAARKGNQLTFKILPASHTVTFIPTGPDTFDGITTVSAGAGSSVTFVPYNDGVNSGYAIE